jgi:hypothetical protein
MRLHTLGGVGAAGTGAASPTSAPSGSERAAAFAGRAGTDRSAAGGVRASVASADTLTTGQVLTVDGGEYRESPNGRYFIAVDEYGVFVGEFGRYGVAYRGDVAYTGRGDVTSAVLRADGNLVALAGSTGRASTGTAGSGATRVTVMDNGNVVLRTATGGLVKQLGLHRVSAVYEYATLEPGDALFGDGGRTTLTMQADGNLVLRQSGAARWSSGTGAYPGAFTVVQPDGNVVLRDRNGTARWSSRTSTGASVPTVALVQNGGFYVDPEGPAVFQTFTSYDVLKRGARLASGKQLRSFSGDCTLTMQTNGNLVARCGGTVRWSSRTSAAGSYAVMQTDGNLVVRDRSGRARWSSGSRSADAYLLVFGRPTGANVFEVVDDYGRATGDVVGVVDRRTDSVVWAR